MEGITIVWEESGGISVVATANWLEGTELVKVSVVLTDAGLSFDPLSGDRARAERFVRSILETDFKQIGEGGGGKSPAELDYHMLLAITARYKLQQEGKTHWRRSIGPGKLADLPDSDRTMWRDLVNLHAPEE